MYQLLTLVSSLTPPQHTIKKQKPKFLLWFYLFRWEASILGQAGAVDTQVIQTQLCRDKAMFGGFGITLFGMFYIGGQTLVTRLVHQAQYKLRGGVERLANYLLAQRSRQGSDATLTLPYEKRFIASLLGMTPENLSRAFASLADYGVEVDGPHVTISRPVALERLAKPDPLIDKHLPSDITLISKPDRERSQTLETYRPPRP